MCVCGGGGGGGGSECVCVCVRWGGGVRSLCVRRLHGVNTVMNNFYRYSDPV